MKKTIIKSIFISFVCTVSFITVSCASAKKSETVYSYDDESDYEDEYDEVTAIEIPVTTDEYLGDFDPVRLEPLMILKKSGKTLSPKELSNFYLVPRTNCIELTYRDNVNEISIIWSKAERDKIIEACKTFLTQYEEKTVPHHKVNPRTAYFNSKCGLWYGVLNADNACSANDYYLNCEFIDKRPYLLFKFSPSKCDKLDQYTPKVVFYMSPSQIRDFLEIIDQDNLESQLTAKREKAYTY